MPKKTRTVSPGPRPRTVRGQDGEILSVPDDWELLPPGDAMLTRRVKKLGACWTVKEKKGRRMFSKGIWAPARRIERLRAEVAAAKASPTYARKQLAAKQRRDADQRAYVQVFEQEVIAFLAFHQRYASLAQQLAAAVTEHATPVGSGTVARTERIPVSQRAEAAVVAWMRHQTTAYERMSVARIKGERRRLRAELAQQSRRLVSSYRVGKAVDPAECPLQRALAV